MFFAHPEGEVCQLLLSLIGSRQPPAQLFSELSRNASPQQTLTDERCVTNLRTAAKETGSRVLLIKKDLNLFLP